MNAVSRIQPTLKQMVIIYVYVPVVNAFKIQNLTVGASLGN